MSSLEVHSEILPARRGGLVIRALGEEGRYVVKDPRNGAYFQLGAEEHFLLEQLDGQHTSERIAAAFERQFGDSQGEADLEEFLELARRNGFLQNPEFGIRNSEWVDVAGSRIPHSEIRTPHSKQSLLHWRKCLFDPDRFFNWLEPRIRFFWTRAFLVVSA